MSDIRISERIPVNTESASGDAVEIGCLKGEISLSIPDCGMTYMTYLTPTEAESIGKALIAISAAAKELESKP